MRPVKKVVSTTGLLAASLSCASALGLLRFGPALAQSASDGVIYLNQGWSQADRETYYQLTQGAEAISYDFFLNMEAAGSQELFRSDANSERYGLITQPANPRTNPDGLPIGLTKTTATDPRWKGEFISLTCAACHNAQLNYQGKKIRIDGGTGNTFDFLAYIQAFDDAMQATLTDEAKFNRLATRMGAVNPDAKNALRVRFEAEADRAHRFRTRSMVTPHAWGPARMDAIGAIVNRVTADEPGIYENWSPPLAPTKIPFVWNSGQSSWVQWRAAQQDPINRNLTEAMGVLLPMDLRAETPKEGLFDANAEIMNLEKIEEL